MLKLHGVVAVVLFVVLTAVVALQVLNRLVLHLPIIWSEETARFVFFWVVLLGAAIGVRRRRHFVVDLIGNRRQEAGGRLRFALDVVPDLCVLGFGLFLLPQSIAYTQTGVFRTATNSGINMSLVYAAIPVFAALSVAYAITNLIADYRAYITGRPLERRQPAGE
jgi:TRAP-type C4-dicarboxylate transport system permease small subunit